MKAIGLTQGLRGDLVISTVAARAFKERFPDSKLVLGMHKDFADMAPLFFQHESFDNIHFYDGYDNWPSEIDKEYLGKAKYDIVFNAMAPHLDNEWWRQRHQTEENCHMHYLPIPKNIQCALNPWFSVPDNKKFVAFSPIGGFYNYPNAKSLSLERAQEIVDFILDAGLQVWQIGHKDEPRLEGVTKKDLSYFDSVKNLLGCKAFITVDTGLCWLSSAYSFPTLGLYSNSYYSPQYIKNIQPIQPNAQYLDAPNVNNIDIELIKQKIIELVK